MEHHNEGMDGERIVARHRHTASEVAAKLNPGQPVDVTMPPAQK